MDKGLGVMNYGLGMRLTGGEGVGATSASLSLASAAASPAFASSSFNLRCSVSASSLPGFCSSASALLRSGARPQRRKPRPIPTPLPAECSPEHVREGEPSRTRAHCHCRRAPGTRGAVAGAEARRGRAPRGVSMRRRPAWWRVRCGEAGAGAKAPAVASVRERARRSMARRPLRERAIAGRGNAPPTR